jgi:hypothetical protein
LQGFSVFAQKKLYPQLWDIFVHFDENLLVAFKIWSFYHKKSGITTHKQSYIPIGLLQNPL